jgi:hypothetical protein
MPHLLYCNARYNHPECHYAECHAKCYAECYAECYADVMVNVIMLNVVTLSVIALSVVAPSRALKKLKERQ